MNTKQLWYELRLIKPGRCADTISKTIGKISDDIWAKLWHSDV